MIPQVGKRYDIEIEYKFTIGEDKHTGIDRFTVEVLAEDSDPNNKEHKWQLAIVDAGGTVDMEDQMAVEDAWWDTELTKRKITEL